MRITPVRKPYILMLLLCLSWLSACNLEKVTPTPLPTPDLPRVEILSPPTSQQVVEGTEFDIDILAIDHSQGIQRIELYVDDFLVTASETDGVQAEYLVTTNWYASGIGWHTFTALAFRADGTSSVEHVIVLQVIPRN